MGIPLGSLDGCRVDAEVPWSLFVLEVRRDKSLVSIIFLVGPSGLGLG